MKKNLIINNAVLAGTALFLGTGAGVFAGEPAPYIAPPAPPSDCSGCIDPGFYLEGSLLYLNSYASDINDYDGDWDFGFRGSVGIENQTGLFADLTGFYYQGDYEAQGGNVDGEIDLYSFDLLIGDTVHCGELCVWLSAGLRYGGLDSDSSQNVAGAAPLKESYEFDGWGPVFQIEAERALNDRFSLYAELRQSILFGEAETMTRNGKTTSDTLASITEIGAGLQVNFGLGPVQNAFIRAGFEGQYWLVDSSDIGLWGGVIKIGGRF